MKDFTTGSESKHIFQFALPMLIGNVFQQMYNIVDSIIVGRFLGDKALAAVGASFPILFMITALVVGIGIGAGVVISQYFGAKKYDEVRKASNTILIFLMVSGTIITFIGIVSSKFIFRLLFLPEELMDQAIAYLNVYMAGMVVLFGYNAISSILRGIGDSKTPLYFLIVATFLNIILDLVFVVVLKWGISGAAWATVISQGVAFVIAIIYLQQQNHLLRISFHDLTFDWAIFRQSVKIGLPTGIQQTLVALGGMALMGIVNTFGTAVIAAYSAASRVDSLAVIPTMSIGGALSGFVGQNVGANKLERVKKGLKASLRMAVMYCIVISAVMVLWGDKIMTLFTTSDDVVKIGHQYLMVVGLFYSVFAVLFSINGLLRGAGAALIPMYITLLSLWLVRVPLAYLFSKVFHMGAVGIWWAIPFGWTMGAIAAVLYYRYGKWQNKSVVKSNFT